MQKVTKLLLFLLMLPLAFASAASNKKVSEKRMAAYLMVFHRDGYHFTALNNARPVISGDTIAEQRGVRDPHIYRGPDGAFYLVATDLHIYAQREGKRATEWERDGEAYGWGNNRGLVLMKSHDLIHWTHTVVNINEMSPELADIGCAWAPETIYDEKTGRLMIYFTMRHKNGPNKLYYVYANNDFNRIETTPKLLFEYPDTKITAIDGDICYAQGKYHLFYARPASSKPRLKASTVVGNTCPPGAILSLRHAKLRPYGSASARRSGCSCTTITDRRFTTSAS